MHKWVNAVVLLSCLAPTALADDVAARREHNWHQWRGPTAGGVAPHGDPPLKWDEKTNVKWKAKLEGEGSATPIVWEDRVFVVAAIKTDRRAEKPPQPHETAKTLPPDVYYQFVVTCFDRSSGEVKWRRVAIEAVPHEGRHSTNTYASASPTTDGQRLYVSFGSRGLFCFDFDGKPLWQRDLGDMRTRSGWGEATSPVVHDGSLIVNWDQEVDSFIAVLSAGDGENIWKVDRDEPTSWATPLVINDGSRDQLIVNGTNRVRSYNLKTGDVIWQCGGQTVNAIPSPVAADGFVVCMSGYRGSAAFAIPLDSTGELTDTERVRWSYREGTPYVPSPIIVGDRLYFTRTNSALLTCLDVNNGKLVFGPQRLPELSNVYASPVAAAGRIYFTDRDGTTLVIRAGDKFDVLGVNKLNEPIDASPAIVGKQMFLRSASNLYCIEDDQR